ncbi:MAG: hypothetical protein KatS3mg009_0044 [Acidimicrobiia bacterium]|nr:MAG: hypothetical protein KatS3mg009_0044 [Acidimicrobiia bacterium]
MEDRDDEQRTGTQPTTDVVARAVVGGPDAVTAPGAGPEPSEPPERVEPVEPVEPVDLDPPVDPAGDADVTAPGPAAGATAGPDAPRPPSGPAPAAAEPGPAAAPGSPWGPPEAGARRAGGARSALVGGVAGALVGALVAGGLVVALDDDPQPATSTPVTVERAADSSAGSSDTGDGPVVEQPGDIGAILDATRPAVVRIDSAGFGGRGTGTGFVVDPGGVVVTNAHVVGNARTVSVYLADGTELEGEVVGRDARFDLAVVEVDRDGLPYLQLGDSDELEVGDPVVAIGNALGLSEGSGATVTTGIVSGLDRVIDLGDEILYNAIQTDAAINPGNSGGPLLDMNGRVVGINTAIASPDYSNNVGFAISISSAKPVIDALREGREPQVAFLGVSTEDVTPRLADEIGVERGAVVATVTAGSAAADAGLEPKDVIVEIDGSPVDEALDVVSAVRSHQPGDRLEITFVRDGDRRTVTVTLGERPDDL